LPTVKPHEPDTGNRGGRKTRNIGKQINGGA
jgi:hypothetical protein